MRVLELLAPAKNLECGIAAIDHGADAVYIGAQRFGARAAAGNSTDDIEDLCLYAHKFGAKVFVTVNTIIYDEELADTLALIEELTKIGVDALLIQDMGLLSLLKEKGLDKQIALHASTQTDNRSTDKVKWLAGLGFRRIVLARELSIEEIAEIHRDVPEVELEVFVHGALCVSYSGQCYASQHCFGRSANRGECAQFCRMPFTLRDADGRTLEEQRHLLSLKDMAQLQNLEALADAGAVSFKIEGRLKDVDYVKNITAAYSEKLNEICRKHPKRYQRASMGRCHYTFTPDIHKSFNRGFTSYFAKGRQESMANILTPKALGEFVGKVKELRGNSFNVASTAAFNNGDGLCFFDSNRRLVGFRVNKVESNRLFPLQMPRELKPGMALYRNTDHAFTSLLAKPSAERKIEVEMTLEITVSALSLTITDERGNIRKATVPYEYQIAQKSQEENIRKQLMKLGNTIFSCNKLEITSCVEQPFIASSVLAALRREATEQKITTVKSAKQEIEETTGRMSEGHNNYPASYLYNAANNKAIDFYHGLKIDADSFERGNAGNMLMQCRYCLRAEMGYCTKKGKRAPWREPLSITLDDGRSFTLKFNCKDCQMEVIKD